MRISTTDYLVHSYAYGNCYALLPLLFLGYLPWHNLFFPPQPVEFIVTLEGKMLCHNGQETIPPSPLGHVYVVKNKQVRPNDPISQLESAELQAQFYNEPTSKEGIYVLKFRVLEGGISTLIFVAPNHKRQLLYVRPTADRFFQKIQQVILQPKVAISATRPE